MDVASGKHRKTIHFMGMHTPFSDIPKSQIVGYIYIYIYSVCVYIYIVCIYIYTVYIQCISHQIPLNHYRSLRIDRPHLFVETRCSFQVQHTLHGRQLVESILRTMVNGGFFSPANWLNHIKTWDLHGFTVVVQRLGIQHQRLGLYHPKIGIYEKCCALIFLNPPKWWENT